MDASKALVVFQGKSIRRVWHNGEWFFSIVDIVAVLTDSTIPKRYWADLKSKLKEENFEPYDKIVQLKLIAEDGKLRETDCVNTEGAFRIIQSIPSPKAGQGKYRMTDRATFGLDESVITIEIPTNFADMIRTLPEEIERNKFSIAKDWRTKTGELFEHYFRRGYVVRDFVVDKENRAHYFLEKGFKPE